MTPDEKREYNRRWRASHPGYERQWRAKNPDKVAAYYERNRDAASARKRAARQQNPAHARDLTLRRRYGITLAEFDAMAAAQDGRCPICGEQRDLVVDHDHQSGKVRGLLCGVCNRKLHSVETDGFLRAALDYLVLTR